MTYDLLDRTICAMTGIDPHCVCSQASVPSVPVALGSGLVLEGCWQRRQCPAGYKGVGWGWSIWGFPYDPLLTPMLLHRSHLSPACLPPRSAAFVRQTEASLSARTGSLTLPVAKTRSSAEEPTVTFALCRTIALHRPSHGTYIYICLKPRRMESMRKAAVNCSTNGHSCMCSTLRLEHVHSYGTSARMHAIYSTMSVVLCTIPFSRCLSHRRIHTHKAQWHTLSHCTLCTLPMPVFSCLQIERSSRSFFTNLLSAPPPNFLHLHP